MLYVGAFTAFILSLGIIIYLVPKLLLLSLRKKMVDSIDSRKIHTAAASRLGGLSFLPAIFLSVCMGLAVICLFDHQLWHENIPLKFIMVFCALLILYVVGGADDIVRVRYMVKFFFQITAAGLVVLSGTWIHNLHGFCGIWELPDCIGILLTIFLLVFIMNSINLIDGLDGLASLLSIIALLVYGTISLTHSLMFDSLIALATLGALIPFFYFNIFKVRKKNESKIFMGDAGSLVIGFILGVLAISLWNMEVDPGHWPYSYVLAYTMLIVPCFDTIRVVFCRLKAGTPIFLPDNKHIHHKLMSYGLTQRQTLVAIVLPELFFLFLNLCLAGVLNITFIVIIDLLCMMLYLKIINIKQVKK